MSDPLLELEQLLPQLAPALQRRKIGEHLGETVKALQDSKRHIRRLAALLKLDTLTRDATDGFEGEETRELKVTARSLAERMITAATAEQLRAVKDDYADFIKDLVRAQRGITERWTRIVRRDFQPLTTIGEALSEILPGSDLGQRLRECGDRAVASTRASDLGRLCDDIVSLQQQRKSLEGERTQMTTDPEIDLFLNAIASGTAPLALVTDRVRTWLAEKGALGNFTVTAKASV